MVLVLQYLPPQVYEISAHTLWLKNSNFLMKENAEEQQCCTTLQTSTISHNIMYREVHILAKSHCYSKSLQFIDAYQNILGKKVVDLRNLYKKLTLFFCFFTCVFLRIAFLYFIVTAGAPCFLHMVLVVSLSVFF